jgi:hypothetical protein
LPYVDSYNFPFTSIYLPMSFLNAYGVVTDDDMVECACSIETGVQWHGMGVSLLKGRVKLFLTYLRTSPLSHPLRYSEMKRILWSIMVTPCPTSCGIKPYQPIGTSFMPMNHTKSVTHQPRIICYLSPRSVIGSFHMSFVKGDPVAPSYDLIIVNNILK